MVRKLILALLSLLSLWRLSEEVLILMSLQSSPQQWSEFLISIGILLCSYVLPLSVLTLFFLSKKGLSPLWFLGALLFGALIIGNPAGLLNNAISTQLTQWFPNSTFLEKWEPSIAPPLVEESLKLGLALIIIYLSRTRSIWSALGIGLGVGLGFEFSEDYTYMLSTMLTPSGQPISEAISRMESIFASHWLLTALMTTATLLLYWKKNSAKSLYLYALAPLVLHILWNSPFGENLFVKVALTIVSWIICISLYITKIKTIDTKTPLTL